MNMAALECTMAGMYGKQQASIIESSHIELQMKSGSILQRSYAPMIEIS